MPESIIFDSGIFVVTVALWAARTLRVAKRLVSWHFSRCAAKQCGCQILEAAGPGSKPRPSCSLIRSRAVLLNSNSYWSDQAASQVRQAARPARIQAGVIYL